MGIAGRLRMKERFTRVLRERFFLRFHMSLILTCTALTGLIVSWALLHLHVASMLIRYPVAVLCSYLAFFGFIKLWLLYITSSGGSRRSADSVIDGADVLDIVPDSLPMGRGMSAGGPPFGGGGGHFSGGGASSFFDQGIEAVQAVPDTAAVAAETAGSSAAEAGGDAASGIFEDGGIVLVILGLLLTAVFGAALYLVSAAPAILAEAAFEFLLASSLLRSAKRMDNPDWAGSVFRSTVIPFVVVLLLALAAAGIANSVYPGATRMSEVIRLLLSK